MKHATRVALALSVVIGLFVGGRTIAQQATPTSPPELVEPPITVLPREIPPESPSPPAVNAPPPVAVEADPPDPPTAPSSPPAPTSPPSPPALPAVIPPGGDTALPVAQPPEIPASTPEPPAVLPDTTAREDIGRPEGRALPEPDASNPFLVPVDPPQGQGDLIYPDGSPFGACGEVFNCAGCGGGSCTPPTLSLYQGVRVLSHSHVKGRGLSFELLPDFNVFLPRMSVSAIGFNVATGYQVTAHRYLGRDSANRDQFFEFAYWGMNHWRTTHTIAGGQLTYNETVPDPDDPDATIQVPALIAGNLFTPFDSGIGGFNRAERHLITYESDINNFELNVRLTPRGRKPRSVFRNGRWRYECQPGRYTSLMVGLRYLSLDEGFRLQSSGLAGPLDDEGEIITVDEVSGDYLVLSHNDMFGFQIGGDMIFRKCRWEWGFRGKAGSMVNFSDQNTIMRNDVPEDIDPFHTTDVSLFQVARDDDIALIGELGMVATVRLRPNFSVHVAYDLMWMTGLSLAAEQLRLDPTRPARVRTNGVMYSHGLSLGMEMTW